MQYYITIIEFDCLYWRRKPTLDTIERILKQRACEDIIDIKAFLGTIVQYQNHIPNFVVVIVPLYKVINKNKPFECRLAQKRYNQVQRL